MARREYAPAGIVRRGRVTDASEPEKTTVVGSGGGQMQLSSAKYLKKKGGRRDAELAD